MVGLKAITEFLRRGRASPEEVGTSDTLEDAKGGQHVSDRAGGDNKGFCLIKNRTKHAREGEFIRRCRRNHPSIICTCGLSRQLHFSPFAGRSRLHDLGPLKRLSKLSKCPNGRLYPETRIFTLTAT
jgi:hypothetical protein